MKRISTPDVTASVLIMLLLMFALVPAVARLQRSPEDAKCQSNMKRWAQALDVYRADYAGRHPINGYTSYLPSAVVKLTPDGTKPDGSVARYQYGLNWVEALYPYVITKAKRTDQDWKSFRFCPNSSPSKYPASSPNPCMSYSFNGNLISQPIAAVRFASKTMMMRELDGRMDSVLRPVNISVGTNAVTPQNPFLDHVDEVSGPTNPDLHGGGSYVVMADGHVAFFAADFFPDQANVSAAKCWDAETQCWYNYAFADPANDTERRINKAVAITP